MVQLWASDAAGPAMQKFRAPPNPFPSKKKLPASDPLAADLAERINGSQGASASGQDRSGSDASDDWEEVCSGPIPYPARRSTCVLIMSFN